MELADTLTHKLRNRTVFLFFGKSRRCYTFRKCYRRGHFESNCQMRQRVKGKKNLSYNSERFSFIGEKTVQVTSIIIPTVFRFKNELENVSESFALLFL